MEKKNKKNKNQSLKTSDVCIISITEVNISNYNLTFLNYK